MIPTKSPWALQSLSVFPRLGRRQTLENARKLVVRRYPYAIYYTVDEARGEVVILTFQHSAQERTEG